MYKFKPPCSLINEKISIVLVYFRFVVSKVFLLNNKYMMFASYIIFIILLRNVNYCKNNCESPLSKSTKPFFKEIVKAAI